MNNTKKILRELYRIDPSLKTHEKELVTLISQMMDYKTDFKADPDFVRELKKQLFGEPKKSNLLSHISLIFMNKKHIFVGALASLAIVLVVGAYGLGSGALDFTSSKSNGFSALFNPGQIVQKEAGAFGSLALGNVDPSSARMFGGGGFAQGDVENTSMIIAPIRYTYSYVGEEFEVSNNTSPVFRRVVGSTASKQIAQILKNSATGLLNLNSFGNLSAETISLFDDEYRINLDIINAQASIHTNYNNKPDVYREAQPSDMLSNEELIAIAHEFLKQRGISVDSYAEPVVDMQWKRDAQTQKKLDPNYVEYTPNMINVVYPFKLDQNIAYNYSGTPEGMNVSVDILAKRVESVFNILAASFESSEYQLETNVDVLKKFASQGGINTYPWYDKNAELREVKLGTPTIVYVQHYMPTEDASGSREMYVPALQFPVVNSSEITPFYHSQVVTIPLLKDILDLAENEKNQEPIDPPVYIMEDAGSVLRSEN